MRDNHSPLAPGRAVSLYERRWGASAYIQRLHPVTFKRPAGQKVSFVAFFCLDSPGVRTVLLQEGPLHAGRRPHTSEPNFGFDLVLNGRFKDRGDNLAQCNSAAGFASSVAETAWIRANQLVARANGFLALSGSGR